MEELEEIIAELIELGLVSIKYAGGEAFFSITEEGAAYLAENGYSLVDKRVLH